ncbi:MAG: hypothetical protein KDC18_03165 [Alphaproteobacteria bacterium]|nr:hypothetical protein [Alphaproteobacteria bacterium]MCB9929947.1 hypothetical protein [Alphaproteobacteria bacterium]
MTLVALTAACSHAGALRNPQIEYLGAGVLMVPIDRDDTGCVRYRLISEARPGDYTVYWRIDEGNYTNNRASADCRSLSRAKGSPNPAS